MQRTVVIALVWTCLMLASAFIASACFVHFLKRNPEPSDLPRVDVSMAEIEVEPPQPSAYLRGFLDRASGDRIAGVLDRATVSPPTEADIAAVRGILADATDDDTTRNEAANILRRYRYAGLDDDLWAVLQRRSERPRFRGFAAQHLGISLADPDAAAELLERVRSLLRDRDLSVRRESLLALVRARDPEAVALVGSGLDDPNYADMRDLLIACAFDLDLRDRIGTIRKFESDADLTVRIAALAALGGWRDNASRDEFTAAAASNVPRLQRAGELALRNLDQNY